MAATSFARALDLVLRHEGGYVDHPRDPGGATNMGITRATLAGWRGTPVTRRDVRRLTLAEAARIYRHLYWDAVCGDELPAGLDYCAFDAAVNSGPARAARWLQRALGVRADGVIGPVTLAAAAAEPVAAIRRMARARLSFLQRLMTWTTFGRGWSRRVRDMEACAIDMARKG